MSSFWTMINRKRQAKIRLRNECGTVGIWFTRPFESEFSDYV